MASMFRKRGSTWLCLNSDAKLVRALKRGNHRPVVDGGLTMVEENVRFVLLPASDEPPPGSQAFETELRAFRTWFKLAQVKFWALEAAFDSFDAKGDQGAEFLVKASPANLPIVAAIGGAWIKFRSGRTVHIEIGDFQVRARTAEAILTYFESMKAFREWQSDDAET